MAKNLVVLRQVQVLEVFENRYTPKGSSEERVFRTLYGFQSSLDNGDRPKVLEMRLHEDEQFIAAEKMVGKKVDLAAEHNTWSNGEAYDFLGTLDDFVKGLSSSGPALVPSADKNEKKRFVG